MRRIYLDYAATRPVDPRVLKAMEPYFSRDFGNPGSLHSFGQTASRAVFLARQTIAQAIGADYREIIFTGSATEANNLVLRGTINKFLSISRAERAYFNRISREISRNKPFGRNTVEIDRPRIIISSIEHESILETAKDLEREGVEVIYLPVSRAGLVDLKKLKKSLNERTALVSIMYANNEIGSIQPISEIARIIADSHQRIANSLRINEFVNSKKIRYSMMKPLLHTDAVQALQYLDCGVNNFGVDPHTKRRLGAVHPSSLENPRYGVGVDLMTLSAHKIYGPKGIGALYVRQHQRITNPIRINEWIRQTHHPEFAEGFVNSEKIRYSLMKPIITGGGQEQNLRSGTENVPYIVGFAKAVELAVKNREGERKRVERLRDYFFRGIKKIYPHTKRGLLSSSAKSANPRYGVGVYPKAEINGPSLEGAGRLPNNLNIYFPSQNANEFLIKLDLAGVAASSGSACSSRAAQPSHVLGVIRLSESRARESIRFTLGRPTTKAEIDKALSIVKILLRRTDAKNAN